MTGLRDFRNDASLVERLWDAVLVLDTARRSVATTDATRKGSELSTPHTMESATHQRSPATPTAQISSIGFFWLGWSKSPAERDCGALISKEYLATSIGVDTAEIGSPSVVLPTYQLTLE